MNPAIPTAGADAGLTATQCETLRVLLDMIVPPSADQRLPGAAVLVRHVAGSRTMLPALRELLGALDREAFTECGAAFASLDEVRRLSLIEQMRTRDPLVLDQLALETVTCYYQQDHVLEGLGLEARPPYPKGYQIEQGDLSLLNPVIARGKMYREIS